MADDPFASLGAPGADPFAHLGQPSVPEDAMSGPMADPFANLGKDIPVLKEAQPITMGSIIRRPREALDVLGRRFKEGFKDAGQHGTVFGLLSGFGTDAAMKDDDRAAAQAYERRSRPMPAGSPTEVATDMASGLVGSVASLSPENFAALPAKIVGKIGIAGRPIVSRIMQRALGDAAVNAAIDPVIQVGEIARKQQETYNPFQTLGAAALGAAVGGTVGGAEAAHGMSAGRVRPEAVDEYVAAQAARRAAEMPDNPVIHTPETMRPVVTDLLPGSVFTSGKRTVEHNAEVGGAKNSYHTRGEGQALDIVPPKGSDFAAFRKSLADRGIPVAELLNEGDHWHLAWDNTPGAKAAAPEPEAPRPAPMEAPEPEAAPAASPAPTPAEMAPEPAHPDVEAADQVRREMEQQSADLGDRLEKAYQPGSAGDASKLPQQLIMVGRESGGINISRLSAEEKEMMRAAGFEPDSEGNYNIDAYAEGQRRAATGEWDDTMSPYDNSHLPPRSQEIQHESDFPGDWGDAPEPREEIDTPEPAISPDLDLTEQALNHLRAGKRPRLGEGPSLVDALLKEGGVRNQGGELSGRDLGEGGRQWNMLVRKNTGKTLAEAAEWAQSKGYIGGDTAAGHPVATPDELIAALEREWAGQKVYSRDRINHEGRLLHDRMDDLEEFLAHLDVDPATHSNAEIRAAMDEYFALERYEAERAGGDPFAEADRVNADGQRVADMEGHERDRAAGRDNQPMEAGGIFDETYRNQADILFGAGGGDERAIKARAAANRIRQMDEILASTTDPNLRAKPKVGANPAKVGEVLPKLKGIPEISRDLLRKLDLVRRQGRVGLKNAAGTYNRLTGMIRTKGAHELDVVAHEIGHAVEFTKQFPTLQGVMTRYEPALKALDYEPAAARRHEGFAEWFRWYVTNPTFADQVLPGFRQDFEAALRTDAPRDLTAIKQAQSDYQAFLKAPSVAAAQSMVVEPPARGLFNALYRKVRERGPLGAVEDFADEIYRGVVDSLNPWKKAVMKAKAIHMRNTGRALSLDVVDDPYKLLRQMPAVASAGHMDLTKGVHGYNSTDVVGPAFTDALKLALGDKFFRWDPKAIRAFGTYLTGRRAIHLYDRFAAGKMDQPPDNLSKEFWEQTVADLELRNPTYKDAATIVHDYTRALWDKRHDAGFVDDKLYNLMLLEHPEYVPLFRDVSDREQVGGAKGADTSKAGGVIRLKGSDRAYANPIHSIMQMTYELNAMIARNEALRALDRIGKAIGPDGGQVVERLPAKEMSATRVDAIEAVDNAARDIGVDKMDREMVRMTLESLFGDEALTNVYRAVDMTPRPGENVVTMWENGLRVPLQLPDGQWGRHMIETLGGATPPMSTLLVELAAMPARVMRAGITTHPAFFAANWIRDQFTASILTDVGYIPGVDNIRGIGKELGQGDTPRIYNVAGGEVGGMGVAQEHRARGARNVQALRQKGAHIRHFASLDGFAKFTEVSETGTRMGIFDRARRKASKSGKSDWAAAKEGAFEARDYMDFDRHGAWPGMRSLIRVIPFLNAGLQALDKTARTALPMNDTAHVVKALFGGPPASAEEQRAFNHALKVWTAISALAAGSMAYRASMRDDPEFEEVADYVRDTHWVFRIPGSDHFAVVPKPYEIASLSNVMERAFEAVTLHDPTAWERLREGLGQVFLPAHDAPILVNPMNVAKNRDSFGAPIVPDQLLHKVEPRDQVNDRTSKLAIGLTDILREKTGGKVDLSPAQVDYMVKGVTGSWGRDLLKIGQDKAPMEGSATDAFVASRFVKDWTRGAVSSKAFWDLASTNDGEYTAASASFGNLVRDGKFDEAATRLKAMKPAERAFVMTDTFAKGTDQQYHPLIRAAGAVRELAGLAKDLQDGDVMIPTEHGLEPLRLTPHQRRVAVDGLKKMAVSEQRNALIASGVEGWGGVKQPLPSVKYQREIEQAAPGVMQALSARLQVGKVMPPEEMYRGWSTVRATLEQQQDPARLAAMMKAKSESGSGAIKRALQTTVPAEPTSR